jgi:hypothetical protein
VALDAALPAAALLLWAGATAALLRLARAGFGRFGRSATVRAVASARLRDHFDGRTLAWAGVLALLAALLTAMDVRRGVLLLYCAAIALFWSSWAAQDRRLWWESPGPRLLARSRWSRLAKPAFWALYFLALLGWCAGAALAGRLAARAAGAG